MNLLSFARYTCALAALTLVACGPTPVDDPDDLPNISGETPTRVADNVAVAIASPEISSADLNDDDRPVWSYEIEATDASYVAPHFASAALPEGARLVVRSRDGSRSWTYSHTDVERRLAVTDGFWAIHVWGDHAVIELFTPSPMPAGAVTIDEYARGFMALAQIDDSVEDIATICGANDGQNAICYASSEPAAYNKGRAVARLVINGSFLCTGWLLGSEGHLVTNNHCIGSSSAASNTTFDFMAEGSSCSSNCRSAGACGGTIVAASSQLIKTHGTLDYTLVKLPTNPTGTYGYLQIRDDGASVGERIYLPEHSAGWGKHLQMVQSGDPLTVTSTTASGGSTCGPNQVTYSSDTQGGSSGSPVLGYSDNLVVALHHCGTQTGCTGLGVRIQDVVQNMGSSLPADAIGGGSTGPLCGDDTCNGSETCETCASDCGPCNDPGPDPDSCIESDTCGGQAPGGCWCDNLCVQYGDCCDDGPCTGGPVCGDGTCSASETCETCASDCGPCTEPDPDSCLESDACGGQAPGGCYCDNLCTFYGDCCSDGPC